MYNITVTTLDSTNTSATANISIQINDTTAPSSVSIISPSADANISQNFIVVNASATDTIGISTIRFYLWNVKISGALLNTTNVSASGTTAYASVNFTNLNGTYYINITANDTAGNENLTSASTIIKVFLDYTYPLIINGTLSAVDNANLSQNWVYFNVSVKENHPRNITFRLYNRTANVNSTTYSMTSQTSNNSINFTSIADEIYTYNATICDIANNCNTTTTKNNHN